MPPRTQAGSRELGDAIRVRRIGLGLSIQDASARSGIGAKSWSRYEAGSAIRSDKVRGVCRALGWSSLPSAASGHAGADRWRDYLGEEHVAWSATLDELYGRACAATFAFGSDLVLDHLGDDLAELARMPRGTHIGQLVASWFEGELPPQFVPRYDYEFMYKLRATVKRLQLRFAHGHVEAHTVLEEIALYLILGNAELLADTYPNFDEGDTDWREWVGDLLSDLDVELYLYNSHEVVSEGFPYHFDRWDEEQFWTGNAATSEADPIIRPAAGGPGEAAQADPEGATDRDA